MPVLYQYFGIYFTFWSREHNPIHVHAKYQDMECIVKLYPDGTIEIENFFFRSKMDTQTLKKIKKFVKKYQDQIREKWTLYHVYEGKIKPQIITRKIK